MATVKAELVEARAKQLEAEAATKVEKVSSSSSMEAMLCHCWAFNQDDNFSVFDTRQIAETLSSSTRMMTMLLTAVAGVSLLVGGIGIMNIMLVSVTERTREIGIRLAIGARAREVLLQFLVEATTLSCVGGIVGIALALAAARFAPILAAPLEWQH